MRDLETIIVLVLPAFTIIPQKITTLTNLEEVIVKGLFYCNWHSSHQSGVIGMKNAKSSMARSPLWRIYYYFLSGQFSTTCKNDTELKEWAAPSCIRPQPAADNSVRDDRCN